MFKKFNFSKFNIFKFLNCLLILLLLIISFKYYINTSYSNIMNTFYSEFENNKFVEAKNTLNSSSIINVLKKDEKSSDLKSFFTSIVEIVCNDLKDNSLTEEQALIFLNEINSYNILNSSLDRLILSLDENYVPTSEHGYNSFLELAESDYENNNLSTAISILNKIPDSSKTYYTKAQDLIEKCKNKYRENIISEANKLSDEEYFSKAIELLSNYDTTILPIDDTEIAEKINEIDTKRSEYLASLTYENDTAASNLIATNISYSNINTLGISSNTSYLVHVDLNNQLVSVYSGYTNNWNLLKEFICSTGISGQDTPKGIFSVTNRGEWFYSDDYEQGGKYWVQFLGDYLFHSLPYDETQSTILDYTLGTPSSHGCIRLKTEDAKWLYDNISDDTKIIIN